MTSKDEIKKEIESIVSTYSNWTIGVTDYPTTRKKQHGNPSVWYQWNPDGEKDAREIEDYFLDKGMKGGSGGPGDADWVYIFK